MSGLFARLRSGLTRSSKTLGAGLSGLIGTDGKSFGAAEARDHLEEILLAADLGLAASQRLADALTNRLAADSLAANKTLAQTNQAALRQALAAEIARLLAPLAQPLTLPPETRPAIILVAGVNGSGKTTTIGKLAQRFMADSHSVLLAAGDTFRAAAQEQLRIWGERAGVPVVGGDADGSTGGPTSGGDAAGIVFQAIEQARAQNIDIVLIDTAGRLQTNTNLMAELAKICRVIKKFDPTAPHHSLLVLDATTGQNAVRQAEAFLEAAQISGLIITKLDSTARGGALIPVAESLNLPVHFIGVGEQAEDLQPFDAALFAAALTDTMADTPEPVAKPANPAGPKN